MYKHFYLAFIAVIITPSLALCQGLPKFIDVAEKEAFWHLLTAMKYHAGTASKYDVEAASPLLGLYLIYNGGKKDQNHKFLLNKREVIESYFDKISRFGDTPGELHIDLPEEGDSVNYIPFGFLEFNGAATFYQSRVFYDKQLNTLQLDELERAKRVAQSVIIPSLSNFEALLGQTDIAYFAMMVGYVAKDFTSESIADFHGEMVAAVVSRALIQKYIDAEITASEILKTASWYQCNKNEIGAVRKISFE